MIGDLIRQAEHADDTLVGILIPTDKDGLYNDTAKNAFFVRYPFGPDYNGRHYTDCYWTIYTDRRTQHVIVRPEA
jgi:hypothetical protein